MITRRKFCILLAGSGAVQYLHRPRTIGPETFAPAYSRDGSSAEDAWSFASPPDSARPYVLWMWMGSNVSRFGITRDLEAMKEAGIGGATIFSLADTATPWAGMILKSPTPEIVTFTEPWWAMVQHAALEARRLGLELILHNCAGYESSGGPWITPELSMQEVIWSETRVQGSMTFRGVLQRAKVDPHPHAQFPDVYIPSLGRVDKPIVEGRRTYYRDIAVLGLPAEGTAPIDQVLDLSSKMNGNGEIEWEVPAGQWTVYRFGHTTTGAMIQPAQWDAMGLECDKLSAEAVTFHFQHVLSEIRQHLGDLAGKTLTTLYCDSYEAGDPTWTPRMREEFQARRGYDVIPWLPTLAGRTVGSEAATTDFKKDMKRTVYDLFRDSYWATASRLTHESGLKFGAEPYEGPWEISEIVQFLDQPAAEFWTDDNQYSPVFVNPVVTAAHSLGANVISAEAFTSKPKVSQWNEHPAWLKPIGDAAFCAGLNRLAIHHFVHQPWADEYRPGNTMGQWGIHFGRNQTWWKPAKAWIDYLWRCQAMLQRGTFVSPGVQTSFTCEEMKNGPQLKSIHRRDRNTDIYFIANIGWEPGQVECVFPIADRTPELWDPVLGSMRDLTDFVQKDGRTTVPIVFAPTQSFFIVFRKPPAPTIQRRPNFSALTTYGEIAGPWDLSFDPEWGGPSSIRFEKLADWTTRCEPGIKYFSGTALYKKNFQFSPTANGKRIYLDLGVVKHIAEVTLNGQSLGVVWTHPWQVDITDAIRPAENNLEVAITNVWANRLIGDEQQPSDCTFVPGDVSFKSGDYLKEFPDWFLKGEKRPSKGRYAFTTWNYFTKESPLEPSGLLGPVKLLVER